jgi:hypothetical protein
MADYQLAPGGAVIRAADKAIIPDDPSNRDRKAYVKWVLDGGTADAAAISDLDVAKQRARDRVEGKAAAAISALANWGTPAERELHSASMREAILYLSGVVSADADVPILAARVLEEASWTTTGKVASGVQGHDLTLRTAMETIRATRATELASVASAATVVAADNIAQDQPV